MILMEIKNIFEGGAATSKWGTQRIDKEDIPSTIKYVSLVTGIPEKDLHPLGSVGKMPTSGDIDLAIDSRKYDTETIHDKMMKHVNGEGVFNKGTKVGSYAVPIAGDFSKGKVQLDFMPVENTKYAKFIYHSPGTKSKYKGATRTILLMAVASSMNEKGKDHFEYDPSSGELTVRVGRSILLNKGMRTIHQYRPKNKAGTAYLKTMKTIEPDEFREMFPHVKIEGSDMVVDDPTEIVEVLFGPGTRPNDVSSAEKIIDLVKLRFPVSKQKEIFAKAQERIESAKLPVPEEMTTLE